MKTSSFASALALGLSSIHTARAGDSWYNPNGGNIEAEVGDSKINYGKSPPWHALNAINDQCGDLGCAGPVTWGTHIVDGNFGQDEQILVDASGSFNGENEPGSKRDLVEMAKATLARTDYEVDAAVKHYTDRCARYLGSRGGCQPGGVRTDDQYYVSDTVNVRYEAPDGGLLAFLNVQMSTSQGGGGGVCNTLSNVGAGVATGISAVNPVAAAPAGIFSLASLLCAA